MADDPWEFPRLNFSECSYQLCMVLCVKVGILPDDDEWPVYPSSNENVMHLLLSNLINLELLQFCQATPTMNEHRKKPVAAILFHFLQESVLLCGVSLFLGRNWYWFIKPSSRQVELFLEITIFLESLLLSRTIRILELSKLKYVFPPIPAYVFLQNIQ